MKVPILAFLLIGYCCIGIESIILALKAKAIGYKAGKAAGIASGLAKGALIGGIGGYGLGKESGGGSHKVIKYFTNPIYSYDPRPIIPYGGGIGYGGHGHGGYGHGGYGHGLIHGGHGHGHGPIIKVLHKHLPHPPQIVNIFHHNHDHFGGGSGIGGHGIGGHGVHIVKVIHEDLLHGGGGGDDDHHHHHHHNNNGIDYPAEEQVVKIIQEENHNIGPIGHQGWS